MSAFSAIFKCPVRGESGRFSRQRTQGGRAAEADARLCLGAIVLGMGCAGDRSWPWDGSGRGRPIRCCRAPHIGASACLRKTSGGGGGRSHPTCGQPHWPRPANAYAVAVPSHAGYQEAVAWSRALRRGARYAAP